MPPRTVEAAPERWRALAELVRQRREDQRLTQLEACELAGGRISPAVWSILENGSQKRDTMLARSLQGASTALGWDYDHLERAVTGEDREDGERTVVFVAMVADRHRDPEPEVFTTAEAAIAYARETAKELMASGPYEERDLNWQMLSDGWLFYATYSVEGDAVWVLHKEVRET